MRRKENIPMMRGERVMDQEALRSAWQEQSEKAFGQVVQWQESHPNATLAEIEKTVHQHLMKLRAQLIQEVAQVSADQPASALERCPHCQSRMHARGRKKRSLQTQGGYYVELERSYFTCPQCGYGFFPPG